MRHVVLFLILLFLILFFLVGCSPPAWAAQDVDPFLGVWQGSLAVAGVTLEFTATFSRGENAPFAGTIDIPAQGGVGIRLGEFKIEGRKITFKIDDPGAAGDPTFKGELDAAGKAISGSFSQGGYEGTFSMGKQAPGVPAGDGLPVPSPAPRFVRNSVLDPR